jgi:hypothetical protein
MVSARSTAPLAIALLAACLALVGGCKRATDVGHFGNGAFYHARDHYRVRYLEGADRERGLLPSAWRIANFTLERGVPSTAAHGDENYAVYQLPNRNGRRVATRAAAFDLRYQHWDRSVIWARTLPAEPEAEHASSAALLDSYVRSAAAQPADTQMGLGFFVQGMPEWRFLRRGPATVDGRSGAHATLDVRRAGGSQVSRITLVIVRSEHVFRARAGTFPMFVVFGLASPPDRHRDHLADLESLVSRVDLARVER